MRGLVGSWVSGGACELSSGLGQSSTRVPAISDGGPPCVTEAPAAFCLSLSELKIETERRLGVRRQHVTVCASGLGDTRSCGASSMQVVARAVF